MAQELTRLDRIERSLELLIAERRESQKIIDEQILELKESQKKTDEQILELKESQKKTDEQLRKTDEQLRRTDRKLEEIGRQLGDMGLVQGEVAEDLFFRNIRYLFKQEVSDIRRNLKKKGVAEYDIVAEMKNGVLVIEIKNKLERRMVDEFLTKRIPRFKTAFPEYRNTRVFGGIGALVVKDEVGRYAEKAGLYVLTQTDSGGAALLNRKGFKAKEF